MENTPLPIPDDYDMIKVLGQGVYGYAVKCVKRDTAETVAVKVLKEPRSNSNNMREVSILEKLRCLDPDKANIVRFHEWFHWLDRTFMVFELLHMTLFDYMRQTEGVVPLNGIQTIIRDVATALKALKGFGLIYTDLKSDNVMLVNHQTQPFRVKLIDFGVALHTWEVRPGLHVQPRCYKSPEVLLDAPFNEAIDVWSLGLLLAKLLLGVHLFPGKHEYDVLRFITDLLGHPPQRLLNAGLKTSRYYHTSQKHLVFVHRTFKTPEEFYQETGIQSIETRAYQWSSLDELEKVGLQERYCRDAVDRSACMDLMREMLQMDPRKRITPSEILAHPFIRRGDQNPTKSSHNETAASEPSQSEAANNIPDNKADGRCETSHGSSISLPADTKMVLSSEQTIQRKEATEQSSDSSPHSVQNSTTNSSKAAVEEDLESVTDSGICDDDLKLEVITDSVETSPAVDRNMASAPSVLPDSQAEASDSVLDQASNSRSSSHSSEVSEPMKEKKKKKGFKRFFSTLRKTFCSWFHSKKQ